MRDIVFRDVRLDEVSAVGELFHKQWRENHIFYRDPSVLLWQFYDNPYRKLFSEDLTLLGAFINNKLVGVHGYMPFVFNILGEKKYGCHLCNWYAGEEIRKGPCAIRLRNQVLESHFFSVCFGFDLTPPARFIHKRCGMVIEDVFPRYIRFIDKENCYHLFKGYTGFESTITEWYRHSKGFYFEEDTNIIAKEVETILDLPWDEFYWDRIAPLFVGPAREKQYLAWRYEKIPVFQYHYICAYKDDALSGLLVYRIEKVIGSEFKVLRIMDILCDEESSGLLLDRVIEVGRRENVVLADFFCTSDYYDSALAKRGFIIPKGDEPYPIPFLFRPLEPTKLSIDFCWQILDPKVDIEKFRRHLYYTKADGDFDRPN